jgi:dihydrodipicolinate reductase
MPRKMEDIEKESIREQDSNKDHQIQFITERELINLKLDELNRKLDILISYQSEKN